MSSGFKGLHHQTNSSYTHRKHENVLLLIKKRLVQLSFWSGITSSAGEFSVARAVQGIQSVRPEGEQRSPAPAGR